MKVFTILVILIVLAGVFMFTAVASPEIEAGGVEATWEGSSSSGKCFIRYHGEGGTQNVRGFQYGNGPSDGGYVGVDNCADMFPAANLCRENIEGAEFDCVIIGQLHNDCTSRCLL